MILSGCYVYGLDLKGRVVLPAHFRGALGDPVVLTRAPGQTLLVVSAAQWSAIVERYEQSVLFRGYYLSAAVEAPTDPNTGRILIPHALREYAGFRSREDLAISGIGRAVRIVAKRRYDQEVQQGEFPSLGQLDRDLAVPDPVAVGRGRVAVRDYLGFRVIEARGQLRPFKLLAAVTRESERGHPVIVDVRQSAGAARALWHVRQECPSALIVGADGYRNLEELGWAVSGQKSEAGR